MRFSLHPDTEYGKLKNRQMKDRLCHGLKMEWLLDGMLNAENGKTFKSTRYYASSAVGLDLQYADNFRKPRHQLCRMDRLSSIADNLSAGEKPTTVFWSDWN